jgi:hypothetical protein
MCHHCLNGSSRTSPCRDMSSAEKRVQDRWNFAWNHAAQFHSGLDSHRPDPSKAGTWSIHPRCGMPR